MEDALPVVGRKTDGDDAVDLVRWSVKETIERARHTGNPILICPHLGN
jgi:hypothetical protein